MTGFDRRSKSAWTRLNRALLLQPKLAEAMLLKADLQLREDQPEQAVATWRQAEAAQAGSPRERIVSFLKAHNSILQQSPDYSHDTAQRLYAESIRIPRRNAGRMINATIAIGLILAIAGLSGNSPVLTLLAIVVTIIVVVAIVQRRKKRTPKSSRRLTDSWNASELRRQRLVTPNVDMTELFAAADYVASQLALKAQSAPVAPTERAAAVAARPVAWETCEIMVKAGGMFHGDVFAVEVKSPHGKHTLDDYGGSVPRGRRAAEQFAKEMADDLLIEGWEPLPKGKQWWSYRFRRPLL